MMLVHVCELDRSARLKTKDPEEFLLADRVKRCFLDDFLTEYKGLTSPFLTDRQCFWNETFDQSLNDSGKAASSSQDAPKSSVEVSAASAGNKANDTKALKQEVEANIRETLSMRLVFSPNTSQSAILEVHASQASTM